MNRSIRVKGRMNFKGKDTTKHAKHKRNNIFFYSVFPSPDVSVFPYFINTKYTAPTRHRKATAWFQCNDSF